MQTGGGFSDDLRDTLRAWAEQPLLPVSTVVVWGLVAIDVTSTWYAVVTASAFVFALGWAGTERVWYLRAFDRVTLSGSEVWPLTREFIGRFMVLGIVAVLPIGLVLSAVAPSRNLTLVLTVAFLLWVIVQGALTFVTPALAFSTRSVREALRIGVGMISSEWPASAPYVLLPAVGVQIAGRVAAELTTGLGGAIAAAVATTLLTSLFRGATARFYLRRVPAGLDGAAFAWRLAAPEHEEPLGPWDPDETA